MVIALLSPLAATAEPIQLKLSFFASDRIETFRYGVKPFVDAINAEGKDLLAITVYPDSALGTLPEQPQMVLKGMADIAFVVPGQTPYRFPDNQLIELPGLFRDTREATLTYTSLIARGLMSGYQDFFVIGAYATDPSIIHSRKPIRSLVDIKGQKIRANNPMEAESLERLGALPTVMPAPRLVDALTKGTVDGAIMSPTAIFQFGGAHLTTNHYLLGMGAAPLLLLMSRKKFDSLSDAAKALVRKYSGEHAAATWIAGFGASDKRYLDQIKTDPQRLAVEPSPSDLAAARQAYQSIIQAWAAKTPHNRALLEAAEAEIAKIRAGGR